MGVLGIGSYIPCYCIFQLNPALLEVATDSKTNTEVFLSLLNTMVEDIFKAVDFCPLYEYHSFKFRTQAYAFGLITKHHSHQTDQNPYHSSYKYHRGCSMQSVNAFRHLSNEHLL
jgi:hypothetical protein